MRVYTPTETKIDEKVDMVIMRATTGDMGILPGHIPYSAILDYGVLRLVNKGAERRLAVFGGVAEVRDDIVTLLTREAHWPDEIDRDQAIADREAAGSMLREKKDAVEVQSSQALMRRSLVMIEVSSYPILSNKDKAV